MTTAHVFISGFVQGIGFRQWIKDKAINLGLSGWVRNCPDGRVEAMFQGQKEKIEDLISLCRKGPFLAEVERVGVEWEDVTDNFETFEIVL